VTSVEDPEKDDEEEAAVYDKYGRKINT